METKTERKTLNWSRILLAVMGGYLASFAMLFCVISIFATLLAFQARGAPNAAQIDAFALRNSSWMGSLALLLAAVAASAWATRRGEPSAAQLYGVIIGGGVGLLNFLTTVIFGGLDVFDVLISLLAAGAGWIGSLPVAQRAPAPPS